jgi:hypothetical protein
MADRSRTRLDAVAVRSFPTRSSSLISCLAKRFFFAALLAGSIQTWAASEGDFPPQYTVDLRKFGYQEPKERWTRFHIGLTKSIAFVDANTLAVSLFTPNPKPGLSVRGEVFGGPYIFETVFLDAKSGQVLRTQQWSNFAIGLGIFPAGNGRFVVWHDLDLSLRSPDGSVIKNITLDSKSFPRGASIRESPSGDTLFAVRADREGDHVLVIRTDDLREITWLDFPGYFTDDGSDSSFAFLRAHPGGGFSPPMDLFVLPITGRDPDPAESRKIFTTSSPGCESVKFLDDKTLGVSGRCHDLTVVSTSGEIQYHLRFDRFLVGSIVTCRNCDLLFFSTYTLTGGSVLLDTFPQAKPHSLILFDRKTQHLVEWQGKVPIKHPHGGGTALSPDGCTLALQSEWYVETYSICGSALGARLQTGLADGRALSGKATPK